MSGEVQVTWDCLHTFKNKKLQTGTKSFKLHAWKKWLITELIIWIAQYLQCLNPKNLERCIFSSISSTLYTFQAFTANYNQNTYSYISHFYIPVIYCLTMSNHNFSVALSVTQNIYEDGVMITMNKLRQTSQSSLIPIKQ